MPKSLLPVVLPLHTYTILPPFFLYHSYIYYTCLLNRDLGDMGWDGGRKLGQSFRQDWDELPLKHLSDHSFFISIRFYYYSTSPDPSLFHFPMLETAA